MPKDYHQTLGFSRIATADWIMNADRKLARKYQTGVGVALK